MAVTNKSAVSGSIPQQWSDDLYAQAENTTFWHNLEGPPGSDMPIIRRDDLTVKAGDTIKYDLVLALTAAGMTGDTALLEGNEEALKIRQASFSVNSLQHAVKNTKLAEILNVHSLWDVAGAQLGKWLARQIDTQIFAEFAGTGNTTLPTTAQWFAGTATTIGGINATAPTSIGAAGTGTMTLRDITELKAYARVNNKIEPIRTMDGQEFFGLVAHPYAVMSLKRDDLQWAQAKRDAELRGPTNPIFTGAAGIWDGVIIYENNNVPTALDGASSIAVARNIFFGAQAMSRGYAYYPDLVQELFSYSQELGIAVFTVYGQALNVFDLTAAGGAAASAKTAIGSLVYYTSAVAPTA